MIKDWLHNTFFDGESTITWGNPVIVSNERNLSLATTDADDVVSMAVDVDLFVSLSTTDSDDAVAFTLTAPVVTKGTWTSDFEASGVIVWPTPAIIGTGPAPRSLSLSTTDEDDTLTAAIEHLPARSLSLSSVDEDDVVSCTIGHEEAQGEPVAGGWTYLDLINYHRRLREALEAQESAERAAAELIRREREEEARIQAEKRAAELAEARRRLAEIAKARRQAEEAAKEATFHVERMKRAEIQARAMLEAAEEEEAMAVCLMMLLS